MQCGLDYHSENYPEPPAATLALGGMVVTPHGWQGRPREVTAHYDQLPQDSEQWPRPHPGSIRAQLVVSSDGPHSSDRTPTGHTA